MKRGKEEEEKNRNVLSNSRKCELKEIPKEKSRGIWRGINRSKRIRMF